ncbi:uncharacterized protein tgoln2 [Brachyhypopomus gauderio]|uniref:uncharacterized protein tgoln2 n=1 Tax=Brachyhypopomus gauderio TaxID=698409 RepID=UPI00404338B4
MRFTVLFLIAVCLTYSQGAPLPTTTEVWTDLETTTEDLTADGASERNGSPDYEEYDDKEDEDEQQDKQLNDTLQIDKQQEQNDPPQDEEPRDEQLDVQEMEEKPTDEEENEEQQADVEYEDQEDDQRSKGNDELKDDQEEEEEERHEEQLNDEQQKDEEVVEEQEGDAENGEVEDGHQPESQAPETELDSPEEDEEDVDERENQTAFKPDRSGHQKIAFNPKIHKDDRNKPKDGQGKESELPEVVPSEPEPESDEMLTEFSTLEESDVNVEVNIDDEEKDGATFIIDTSDRDTDLLDDPLQEETSHFFTYIVFTALLVVTLYIGYHNKRKIVAFICGSKTKSGASRRPNSADYQKLDQSW